MHFLAACRTLQWYVCNVCILKDMRLAPVSVLAGFQCCAHVSFLLWGEYPQFHHTVWYQVFSAIDPLTHVLRYVTHGQRLYLCMALWHYVKRVHVALRYMTWTNVLDTCMHGHSARAYPWSACMGLVVWAICKRLRWTW